MRPTFALKATDIFTSEGMKAMQKLFDLTTSHHNQEIAQLVATGLSEGCAADVSYLRTRSRWTPELERRLIESHKAGRTVMICDWPYHEDGNYDPYTGEPLQGVEE